eukprot:6068200-Lingulodinium_polyedra.AAC.1
MPALRTRVRPHPAREATRFGGEHVAHVEQESSVEAHSALVQVSGIVARLPQLLRHSAEAAWKSDLHA